MYLKLTTDSWDALQFVIQDKQKDYDCFQKNSIDVFVYGYPFCASTGSWVTANEICPSGWYLPGDTDWTQLTEYLGGEGYAGTKLKGTGITYWNNPDLLIGDNSSGFTALPGGFRNHAGIFYNLGSEAYFWYSTEANSTNAWSRLLDSWAGWFLFSSDKEFGFSVRCLMDTTTNPFSIDLYPTNTTSIDGQD